MNVETVFKWPGSLDIINLTQKKKLLVLAMERAVVFFFRNFSYTFGGEVSLQLSGRPIGVRLTTAVARLVMEEWKSDYDKIQLDSQITELLSGLYVDDGRSFHRK